LGGYGGWVSKWLHSLCHHPNKSGDDKGGEMRKSSKPWLSYKSDAPEREYFKTPKKKRQFKLALFWLLLGGYLGAHRFYMWDYKKAWVLIVLYNAVMITSLMIFSENLLSEDDPIVMIIFLLFWLLIIIIEFPRLKPRVKFKNEEHLIT